MSAAPNVSTPDGPPDAPVGASVAGTTSDGQHPAPPPVPPVPADPADPADPGSSSPVDPARRRRRRRVIAWLAGLFAVSAMILGTVVAFRAAVGSQAVLDPRSRTGDGAMALATLLEQDGIRIEVVDTVADAEAATDAATTLVVVDADRLSDQDADRVRAAGAARVVLLAPSDLGLRTFGVDADRGPNPEDVVLTPSCSEQSAVLAGDVRWSVGVSFRPENLAEVVCYPRSDGYGYVRVDGIDLLGGGVANVDLADRGNAALAMNVLGGQPRLVWLMARDSVDVEPDEQRPTLLPPWWQIGVVQAVVALVVLGVWRGRRLGPILSEPLPVRVRAAETVEGHGRLYQRLAAYDRAAAALRGGTRLRLARAYGQRFDDVLALSAAVGLRIGREPGRVRALLDGPPPTTDDELQQLARDLDHLEQEARRP